MSLPSYGIITLTISENLDIEWPYYIPLSRRRRNLRIHGTSSIWDSSTNL